MSSRTRNPWSSPRSRLSQALIFIFIAVFTALAVSANAGGSNPPVSVADDALIDGDHQSQAEHAVTSVQGEAALQSDKGCDGDVSHGSWPAVTLLAALRSRTRGS